MAVDGLNGHTSNLTFYPAYCYKASPTYFAWVKLTALDVHNALSTRPGFEGQNIYFYLNHPIQFVYLVGVVVSYEDFHERRWILIIDDSSGVTIEVTCPKPEKKLDGESKSASDEQLKIDADRIAEEQARANTVASIDVGSVIKVKGKVCTFRDTRQIQLERIAVVPDTNVEMHFWEQRRKLKLEVLSRPWTVSSKERTQLLKAAEGRNETERARLLKRKEREASYQARENRHAERIVKKYEEEEVKRKEAAEIARRAGEMLMGNLSSRRNGIATVRKKTTKHLQKS
jgi:Telomere regulation protein Stn1